MSEDISALRESISQYETQLSQVQLAVAASPAGPDRDNLVALQSDIQELITLTKENLSSLQSKQGDHLDREYALLKAELEECESTSNSAQEPAPAADIQEDLEALQGMKCQAPHSHQYGDLSYHNALVCAVERNSDIRNMNQIQVRVMFTNPTHRNMLPCPYYLEGECRFSDDQCHYSHGELVLLSSLKEYKEPDFGAVCPGVHVLVQRDDKLWHRAVVLTSSGKTKWQVKLESSGKTEDVDLQCILPLGSDSGSQEADDTEGSTDDDDSDSDSDVDEVDPSLVERSLLTAPASTALGEWEKHTRGIGSRLMARMGYVTGTGLGKDGEGRVEPVEAMVFPAGKSLDHCMELREKAGGDDNLFRVEKRLRRLQRKQAQQSARQKQVNTTNVFDFINTKLGGGSSGKHPPQPCGGTLKTETNKGLNVEGLRVSEEIRRAERDLGRLQESLSRHSHGSSTHSAIASKLANKQAELDGLRASERNIDMERALRKNQKKLSVF